MVSVNRTGRASDLDLYFPRFWCNNNLYLNALFKDNESSYAFIRYGDLVVYPLREISRLSAFLGIKFDPGMLLPENRHQRY